MKQHDIIFQQNKHHKKVILRRCYVSAKSDRNGNDMWVHQNPSRDVVHRQACKERMHTHLVLLHNCPQSILIILLTLPNLQNNFLGKL